MRPLLIEWRHLDKDGNTCARCNETGETLQDIINSLKNDCEPCGWYIRFKETKLTASDLAESNSILINNRLIEEILPKTIVGESHCESCCEFTGNEKTVCRTLKVGGQQFEAIPAALIREAVCEVAQCC